jgi:hypothetical protein
MTVTEPAHHLVVHFDVSQGRVNRADMVAEDSFERIVISHLHSLAQQLASLDEMHVDQSLPVETDVWKERNHDEPSRDAAPQRPVVARDQLRVDLSEAELIVHGGEVFTLTFEG